HQGQASLGPITADAPEHAGAASGPAVGYVRPHEIEIARSPNGTPALEAAVRHISAVGPVVRIDLERIDNGERIDAELPKDEFRELGLQAGETVFVKPKRMKVFVEETIDYAI